VKSCGNEFREEREPYSLFSSVSVQYPNSTQNEVKLATSRPKKYIQGVSKIPVLTLTRSRTCQMKRFFYLNFLRKSFRN
jgi:hypothetical protein